MKKIILLFVVALSIATISCRKERTCECKTTRTVVRTGFGEGTTVENSSTKVTKEKQKKNAFKNQEACFSESYSYNTSGGNGATSWSAANMIETKCELE